MPLIAAAISTSVPAEPAPAAGHRHPAATVLKSPAGGTTPSSSAVSSSHSLPTSASDSSCCGGGGGGGDGGCGGGGGGRGGEDSVKLWVNELRWYVEADCSNVLHNKAIPQPAAWAVLQHPCCHRQPPPQQQQQQQQCMLASPRVSVDMLEMCSRVVLGEFNKILQCLHGGQLKRVHPLLNALTGSLRRFLENLRRLMTPQGAAGDSATVGAGDADFAKKEHLLKQLCHKLDASNAELLDIYMYVMSRPAVEVRFLVVNGHLPTVDSALRHLSQAAEAFAEVLDAAELALIRRIVFAVRSRTSGANFTAALRDLLRLAMKSERLSCLVAKARAIESLLEVCSDQAQRKYWPLALRVLSAVCCVEEAIRRFDQMKGLAVVTGILSDPRHSELVRAEAAGVVAQLTSPCVLGKGKDLLGCLTSHAEALVRSLTLLCKEANCHDVFLLASAAIANITFISPASFEYMLKYNTVRALVDACQLTKAFSLFAKDQVATVLANMAAYSWCHASLTRFNCVELLLHFLSESPRGAVGDAASRAACERLQQKAAIALSRLARDASAAQIAVELNGATRLGELCRRPEERNCSDAVLVAALAALRQIHDSLGSEDLDERDVAELIKPRLSEAFLACSRLDESYV